MAGLQSRLLSRTPLPKPEVTSSNLCASSSRPRVYNYSSDGANTMVQQSLRDNIPMATTDKADLSRITVLPGQRSGQPCIRGLRVTVWDVLDMLASGMTEAEILNDYPYLEKADFPAVYAYASQTGRERISR